MPRPPKSLFVIGGGAIGCEFAQLFSTFGSKVFIADVTPRLLVKEDQEVSELVKDVFKRDRGMEVLPNTKVIKVAKEGFMKRVTFQQGSQIKSVKVEEILLAAGKVANVDLGLENAGVQYTRVASPPTNTCKLQPSIFTPQATFPDHTCLPT